MTDLEYIEEQIETISSILEEAKKQNYCFAYFKEYNEELHHLQQIKTVLEAWEIAKENKVDLFHIEVLDTAEEFNYDLVSQYQLTEEEFNKLKKALEVE